MAGVRCVVVAPSKLERPPGDRVKTDRRDAERLARLLHIGELAGVRVPTQAEEAARDLVRAREDARADLMRARHRLSKLLCARAGLVRCRLDQAHARWLGGVAWSSTSPAYGWPLTKPRGRCWPSRPAVTAWTAPSASWPRHRPGRRWWAGWAAWMGRGADQLRPGGGDRRLASLHRGHPRRLAGLGAQRAVQRRPPRPGPDHQDRQQPCPTAAGRAWPGITANPIGPAASSGPVRTDSRPRSEHAPTLATAGCSSAGVGWTLAPSAPPSAWSRSPASLPAGAGAWPSWRPDRASELAGGAARQPREEPPATHL